MDINAYLDRIHYQGPRLPTRQVLFDVHRAHLRAITYENLDIHLGRTLTLDISHIFDKIVTRHRGGWCYEMNGLLAWALSELGFVVTLLPSAVNREKLGDKAERNHLILLVQLEQPYLVDVGFGNGFLQPLPLKPGHYRQDFLTYELAQNIPTGISQIINMAVPATISPYSRRRFMILRTSAMNFRLTLSWGSCGSSFATALHHLD